ncbi:MAG: deoxynucleoside kinase [Methylophilaceae bacterium]|jgi:deoxyadenosine/deoxycytidine kinase|nr:deoxynucleoside kinase [Methylophilaceae bacterium]
MTIFDKFPFIVVEGPIGSGKTTLARMLSEKFSTQLLSEKAEENPFLERFYKKPKRYALQTQIFFLFQRARQIADTNQVDMFSQPITADFFLEKDPLFARLNLNDEEYALYHQVFHHLQLESPKPDLVIYLQTPVSVLTGRIAERNINYENNMPPEYLERLATAYSEYFHGYDAAPVLIVNNEKLNIIKDEAALNFLVDRIDQFKGRREYFNPNFE